MNIYLKLYTVVSKNPLLPFYKSAIEWFTEVARFEKALDDWSKTPEGALYKTVAADGTVDYWDDEPYVRFDSWESLTGPFYNTMWEKKYGHINIPLGYDWRLAKRSNLNLTPTASVL